MQPRIFEEKNQEQGPIVRPVYLRLMDDLGDPTLKAFNENGEEIATLLAFTEKGVMAYGGAKEDIEFEGYDTSFALWSKGGAIVLKY